MPAPQPTADDLQQVLDRLARVLNERRTNYALIGDFIELTPEQYDAYEYVRVLT